MWRSPCSDFQWDFSVWSLHVLLVYPWIFSWHFLLPSKTCCMCSLVTQNCLLGVKLSLWLCNQVVTCSESVGCNNLEMDFWKWMDGLQPQSWCFAILGASSSSSLLIGRLRKCLVAVTKHCFLCNLNIGLLLLFLRSSPMTPSVGFSRIHLYEKGRKHSLCDSRGGHVENYCPLLYHPSSI